MEILCFENRLDFDGGIYYSHEWQLVYEALSLKIKGKDNFNEKDRTRYYWSL
jgi:hypothetical protein